MNPLQVDPNTKTVDIKVERSEKPGSKDEWQRYVGVGNRINWLQLAFIAAASAFSVGAAASLFIATAAGLAAWGFLILPVTGLGVAAMVDPHSLIKPAISIGCFIGLFLAVL